MINLREKSKHKGRLIAIEGIDGAGTTTQTAAIARWLRRKQISVLQTMEPSRGPIGRHIRSLLKSGSPSPELLALLFAADRLDHLEREIHPALEQGRWVLTDRYLLSSMAYQGVECPSRWVKSINSGAPPADLTVLIDIPVNMALERISSRGEHRERFERQAKLKKIRLNYLRLAKGLSGKIIKVDGRRPVREVSDKIKEAILDLNR